MAAGAPGTARRRPRLGVFKLASCDGCQLQLLSLEDELLSLAAAVEIVVFAEATSRVDDGLPLDLCLVEGSVSAQRQLDELRHVRERSRLLVAIGACATAGGIQALRNFTDVSEMVGVVYARPEYVDALSTCTPISEHVTVDLELRGCPVDRYQLLDVITSLLVGRRPAIRDESVCAECKRRGVVCVAVASDEPCLGPLTHAGCGALCPRFGRGCFGCFGPREAAQTESLADLWRTRGMADAEIVRRFRGFTAWAEAFREESERHDP